MTKTARIIAECIVVLLGGVAALAGLSRLRQEPVTVRPREQAIRVEAIEVHPEAVPVIITGYGPAHALNVVTIMPEVSGSVIEVHPRLEVGGIIPKGEILFAIDPRTYDAQVADGEATIEQLHSSIEGMKLRHQMDRDRLKTLERTQVLARTDFERMKDLFEIDRVGAKAGVELAEQAFNMAKDQVDRMAQELKLYPGQLKEANSRLASAEARLEQGRIAVERTRVAAPFDARIKAAMIESGQYVAPGTPVLILADDSIIEISVPLDSREARRWLQFDDERKADTAWFSGLKPVECTVRWTEDDRHSWVSVLHRVEQFDEQTRTLTVAVRMKAEQAVSTDSDALPLVDGMFCEVAIPGRVMEPVFRLPRTAVSFNNTVCLSKDNRLHTVEVVVGHEEEGDAFVSEGLDDGDLVVVTRLANPQENSLLDVEIGGGTEPPS